MQLDEVADVSSGRSRELIAVDDALKALMKFAPRQAKVMSVEETAEVMKVSVQTVAVNGAGPAPG